MSGSDAAGRLSGYLCALGAVIIWSGNFIAARWIVGSFPPVSLALFRWMVAAAVVLPLGLPRVLRQRKVVAEHFKTLALAALLGVTLFNTLIYIASEYTTALNLSLIATFNPVFILVLARAFLGEAITLRKTAGIALAVFGVVSLVTGGDYGRLAGLELNFGDLLMLCAAFLFAVYSILVKRKPARLGQFEFLTCVVLIGFTLLCPWAALEWAAGSVPEHAPGTWAAIVYLGLGPSLVAFYLWIRAIGSVGPAASGFVYYTLPLFTGLEAWAILGEPASWIHAASAVCIIGGILLATTGVQPGRPDPGNRRRKLF
jgi:drug/metabolite transporter (DMT)-like permease